ncbi:hypothetical protein KIPB_009883, partial [Kipferlia bialata]
AIYEDMEDGGDEPEVVRGNEGEGTI